MSDSTTPPPTTRRQSFTLPYPSYTSPIALAAASSLRRASVSSGSGRPRADSMSSLSSSVASSVPADDVPIQEEEDGADVRQKLERRMSLGGRWVRPRQGSVSMQGQGSPTITRGFFLDPSTLRTRRQSISTMPLPSHVESSPTGEGLSPPGPRERRASESAGQLHDPLQERILKGDFIF